MGFIVTSSFVEIIHFDHIHPYTISCHPSLLTNWLLFLTTLPSFFHGLCCGGCKTSEVNLGLLTRAWVTSYSQEHRQLLHFTFEIVLAYKNKSPGIYYEPISIQRWECLLLERQFSSSLRFFSISTCYMEKWETTIENWVEGAGERTENSGVTWKQLKLLNLVYER